MIADIRVRVLFLQGSRCSLKLEGSVVLGQGRQGLLSDDFLDILFAVLLQKGLRAAQHIVCAIIGLLESLCSASLPGVPAPNSL